MPFVRVSRDKRGYEHIYLVHTAIRRGKPSRSRILYWFRTPPGVMVGREPFDPAVRRAIETQNPGVTFDWDKLVKMAVPPPDVEPWRERRRAERAARQARLSEEREPEEAAPADVESPSPLPLESDAMEAGMGPGEAQESVEPSEGEEAAPAEDAAGAPPSAGSAEQPRSRRRRRRRGGRRNRPAPGSAPAPSKMPPEPSKGE